MHTSVIQLPGAGRRRGRYSDEFKCQVMAACKQPGVSTATVALANGLNANLLRRWITESQSRLPKHATAKPTNALAIATQSKRPMNPYGPRRCGRGCDSGGCGRWRPAMRQQLADHAVALRRQAGQHIIEIGIRIMPVELCTLNQTHDGRTTLARTQ